MKQSKIKISPAQELVMNIVGDVNLLDIYILSNKEKMPIEGETPTIYCNKDDLGDMIDELDVFLNEGYYIGKSVNIFTSTNQKYTFYIESDNDLIIEVYDSFENDDKIAEIYLSVETAGYLKKELTYWRSCLQVASLKD